MIRCDQGTNLVGAKNELEKALSSVDRSRVRHFLLERNCDWIEFQLNIPSASHMGGVWEREIITARNMLSVLLDQCGSQLNDESLQTFMTGVEAVVNSRPLTVENLTSPDALEPITPNHLLTGNQESFFHHLESFNGLTYIFERDGGMSNIWPTSSGSVGKESSFIPFNCDRSGCVRDVTSSKEML